MFPDYTIYPECGYAIDLNQGMDARLVDDRVAGILAQPERNERKGIIPNARQKEFAQRYIYGRCYRRETWEQYLERHTEKRLN